MTRQPAIWIDFENTPHVPFFLPILLELEREGAEVVLTARDFAQTVDLVQRAGLTAMVVGGEYGHSTFRKSIGLATRATQLAWYMKSRNISLAVGHGSRGLLLASKLLRIPSLTLYDYEGASVSMFNKLSTYVLTPEVIPYQALKERGLPKEKHLTYPGLKESVYISEYLPSDAICEELGLDRTRVIVTVRPPSLTAHYRNDKAMQLFLEIMSLMTRRDDLQIILMPRNPEQRAIVNEEWGNAKNVIVPKKAVDGVSLLYHSDLVIGGGGTMNREAAVLGVPVISIFKGPQGAVDRSLIDCGEMIEVNAAKEIEPYLHKRNSTPPIHRNNVVRDAIVSVIMNLAKSRIRA